MSQSQRSPDRNELKAYLKSTIDPLIEPMVVEMLKRRPDNIYEFAIEYLEKHRPQTKAPEKKENSRPQTPAELQKPSTPIQSEKAEFYAEKVKDSKRNSQVTGKADAGSSSEEEAENDDEINALEELQKRKTAEKKNRGSVSAEVYGRFNKKEDFVAREIQKTAEQKERIVDKLSKAFMFANLEEKEKEIVINAMEVKHVKAGETVIQQGDDGAELYILGEGELDCYKQFNKDEERKHLKVYQPGESFGELALLYNAPRAATIIAKTDAELYALDRATFNNIVKDAEVKRRDRFEAILEKIELLQSMDPYERSRVADVATIVNVPKGQHIIKQGESGDKFYFLESGEAYASKVLQGKTEEEDVLDYKSGDYFGELALLRDEPRAANVIAKTDVTLLALDRIAFNRVLGPLADILKRNAERYNKFM